MSELAENITANQSIVHLDDPLPTSKRFYRLGTELVEVTGRRIREGHDRQAPDGRIINILRGQGDTAAQAHDAGTEFEPYVDAYTAGSPFVEPGGGAIAVTDGTTTVEGVSSIELVGSTVTDEGGGVAGVAVKTRLLGPYTVEFDDTDINVDNILLGDVLPDGAVVFDAWVVTRNFKDDLDTGPTIDVVVSDTARTTSSTVVSYPDTIVTLDVPTAMREEVSSAGTVTHHKVSTDRDFWTGAPDLKLAVSIFINGGGTAFESGTALVYALIAEPV